MSDKIDLGNWGEEFVAKTISCPKCKKNKTLKKLVQNFKCADLICDFCGFIVQVKTSRVADVNKLPKSILGAAWKPQSERMAAGIYTSLFVVLKSKSTSEASILFLPSELQVPEMFIARKPLSQNAKRAGWQGFLIDSHLVANRFVKLA